MNNSPRLFSKLTIVVFSTLGSTFFGSVLYATNLKETNKSKFIVPALIFGIIYTLVLNKLTLQFGIPNYYSFLPIHLIGGLLLAGPFWKYHIGEVDSFEKRKIWGPAIVLIVPICLLLLYIFYNKNNSNDNTQGKLSVSEFRAAAQAEYDKAFAKASFVAQDSHATFFDINVPLLESSYFFTTKVEDVSTLYNYVDYDEGRFMALCVRMPLSVKDEFNLSMLSKEYSFTQVASTNSEFPSLVCANYIRRVNDTLIEKGTIALIKVDNIGYQYLTQFTDINQADADYLSLTLINNIFPDTIAQGKRKLDVH